jgi:hypothetical protein
VNKVRDFLKGKKAYITAAIGLLGAIAAWADGQIDGVGLAAAAWAAVQAVFLRIGMQKAEDAANETIPATQVKAIVREAAR